MAAREVTVVINGEEYVSKAAHDAGKGMDRFTGGIKGWFKSFVDLKAAWDLAVQAATALKDQVVASFAALDTYRSSLQKLEGAAKLTGTPLKTLEDLARTGREAFSLSSVVANDFAAEVAKLASKAGDTTKAKDALASFLEIGAARGLSSAETLQAVQQAILGIDEGTDKLFGKNPSVIYKEFADRIGTTAGKLTDQQKAQALLTETVDSGLKVQGTYAKYLESSAGKQEQMNNALTTAQIAFAQTLDPLRAVALQLGTKLLPVLTPVAEVIGRVLVLALTQLIGSFNSLYGAVGFVAEGIGRLTGKDELADWGRKAQESAIKLQTELRTLQLQALGLAKDTETAAGKQQQLDAAFRSSQAVAATYGTQTAAAHDKVKSASAAAAAQLEADTKTINAQLSANLGPPLKDAIKLTEGALRDLGESAKVQLDPTQAQRFSEQMATLVTRAGDVRARIEAMPAPLQAGTSNARSMAEKVAEIARAGADAAQAFGVMNADAAATLNSVINMGVAIARVAGGDASAIPALIASAANIIAKMMGGENERRRLIQANTEQLRRLTEEVGTISLDVTGETFGKVQAALTGIFHQLQPGRGARNQADIFAALAKVGLSFADLKKVADQLGIAITSQSGAISVDGIRQLLEAMDIIKLGRVGTSFSEQLRATRAGFDVKGTEKIGQVQSLLQLLIGFLGPEMQAVAKLGTGDMSFTLTKLMEMFEQFSKGGFTAAELGGLTGQQFFDMVVELIGMIKELQPGTDVSIDGIGGVPSGGAAAETVQDSISTQTEVVSTILRDHTTLHTRVALATERTALAAESILATIKSAMAGGATDSMDRGIEEERRLLAAQRGFQLSF